MIVASIDLMDGKAVQLRQGSEKVLDRDDPLDLASEFDRFGEVAIIDLDAALGKGDNRELIKSLLKRADCRLGGGIKTVAEAREWVSLGAKKIIIGSLAFENDQLNRDFLTELGAAIGRERVIVAVDSRNREIVTRGWRHRTGLDLLESAAQLNDLAGGLLFTCVEREGTMEGIDPEQVRDLLAVCRVPVTVAGGVRSVAEIEQLSDLGVDIQLGMALYTGEVDLAEGFIAALNWKEDLLPAIIQDPAGQVLMLGYVNADSLRHTFATGKMTFFSRSRQKLWTKGETSGHFQMVQRLRADCDRDTLLVTVAQQHVACHTGWYSCFGEQRFALENLQATIADRFENAPPDSYTARLKSGDLVYEKILEEAGEVVEAREREHIIWEAADVLYFVTALLSREGIAIDEVFGELRRRRLK